LTKAVHNDKFFKIAFATWWLIWAAVHFYVLIDQGLPHAAAFIDCLITNVLLAAFCLLISNNLRYYLPGKERYAYLLVISIGLSWICILLQRLFIWLLTKSDASYISFVKNTTSIRFAESFLLIGCMAAISILWYAQQEQREVKAQKTEAENLEKEAELFNLRHQLQPHFLFNSLNSISALTIIEPDKARHMIQQLSDFLRGTLKKDDKQWNTLTEELQHLQLYLDIEKVRFGHRLQTIIEVAEADLQTKIPSLLLQPIVENAIKFGLYDTTEAVTITIKVVVQNAMLVITIQNPYDAATAQPLQGTGFGLSSIQRRLFLLFGRYDLLHIEKSNNLFNTKIIIPQLI
jgi:two-component system, LytTR family, sensor kinase